MTFEMRSKNEQQQKVQLVTTSVLFSINCLPKSTDRTSSQQPPVLAQGDHTDHVPAANRGGRSSRYQQLHDSYGDAASLKAGYSPGLPTPTASPSALLHVTTIWRTCSRPLPPSNHHCCSGWRQQESVFHCFCGHSNSNSESRSLRRAGDKQVHYPAEQQLYPQPAEEAVTGHVPHTWHLLYTDFLHNPGPDR